MKTLKEKIPSMIISLILASLGLGLKYLGVNEQQSVIAATMILIISFIIMINVYRPIRRALIIGFTKAELEENGSHQKFYDFRKKLTELAGVSSQSDIAQNAGLSGWHKSIEDAESEIIEYIKTAKSIRLLTNTGKSDLAKGSRYYNAIAKNKEGDIQVLMSATDSPFIGEKWAIQNGFERDQSKVWIKRVKDTFADLQYLQTHHKITLCARFYKLPFTWHLWIFDQSTVFVTSWIKQDKKPRVYKIVKNDDVTLFDMFIFYYERIWNEQSSE